MRRRIAAASPLARRCCALGRIERAALAGIDRRQLVLQLLLAIALQLLLRAEAEIRLALAHQPLGVLAINRQAVALAIGRVLAADVGAFVPVDAHPLQIFEQLAFEARLAALDIGVFNAQHHHAARLPREQPVEQRGAGIADVQLAGGRGSEANADLAKKCSLFDGNKSGGPERMRNRRTGSTVTALIPPMLHCFVSCPITISA